MANMAELVDQVPEAAQRMWTSALQLRGKEFCFILNDTVRDDDEELADPMAVRRSNSDTRFNRKRDHQCLVREFTVIIFGQTMYFICVIEYFFRNIRYNKMVYKPSY